MTRYVRCAPQRSLRAASLMLQIAAAGLTIAGHRAASSANAQSLGYAHEPPMSAAFSNLPPREATNEQDARSRASEENRRRL